MSSPWRITRGDQQFTVKDVAELKLMAADSKIESNDLIQRPDGTEWLYATEVTELSGLIKIKPVEEDDDDDFGFGRPKRGSSPFVRKLAAGLTIAMLGAAFFGLYYIYAHRPDPESTKLFGGGTDDLKPLDALATENAALLDQPDSGASQVGELSVAAPDIRSFTVTTTLGAGYTFAIDTVDVNVVGAWDDLGEALAGTAGLPALVGTGTQLLELPPR